MGKLIVQFLTHLDDSVSHAADFLEPRSPVIDFESMSDRE